MIERAFNARLSYNKSLYDPLSDLTKSAPSWTSATTGIAGSGSGFILSLISQHLDKFLVEYLRVNEEACAKR